MTGSTAKPGIKGSITKEEALIAGADQALAQSATRVQPELEQMAPAPENYRMPIGTSEIHEPAQFITPWPDDSDFDWIADISTEQAQHMLSAFRVHLSVAKHALNAARHTAAHPEGLNPNHAQLQADVASSELSVARSSDLVFRLTGILS